MIDPTKNEGWPDLKPWWTVKEDEKVARMFRKAALWLSTVAMHAELHSKDPRTKVGAAILTPDWKIISMGYNGFPIGTPDDPAMWADRETKYKHVIHAESNAIDMARQDLSGTTMICNLYPCHLCAQRIAQNRIKTLYFSADPRQDLEFDVAKRILHNAGVTTLQVKGVARVSMMPVFAKAPWDE